MSLRIGPKFGFIATLAAGAVTMIGALLMWQSRDTTIYSDRYREEIFRKVRPGMKLQEVYSLLGQPLGIRPEDSPERWCYSEVEVLRKDEGFVVENFLSPSQCVLFDEKGKVLRVTGARTAVTKGMTTKEVLHLLGQPKNRKPASVMTLHYTAPGGEGLFRGRIVAVDSQNRVSDVISYQFYD